jgi:hypothetical protein
MLDFEYLTVYGLGLSKPFIVRQPPFAHPLQKSAKLSDSCLVAHPYILEGLSALHRYTKVRIPEIDSGGLS